MSNSNLFKFTPNGDEYGDWFDGSDNSVKHIHYTNEFVPFKEFIDENDEIDKNENYMQVNYPNPQ